MTRAPAARVAHSSLASTLVAAFAAFAARISFALTLAVAASFASPSPASAQETPAADPYASSPGVAAADADVWAAWNATMAWQHEPSLTLRATVFTGYMDVLSVSAAWHRHPFLEGELGVFVNPLYRYTERTTLPPDEVGGEPIVLEETFRRTTWGLFLRGGLHKTLVDTRGVFQRPWTIRGQFMGELRNLYRGDRALLLLGIGFGVDATYWLRPGTGLSIQASFVAPFVELVNPAFVSSFQPVSRLAIGVAF